VIFQTKYSKSVFLSLATLFVFHSIASLLSLYYVVKGLDKVAHFWGGLSVAIFFVWFFYFSGKFNMPAPKDSKIFFILLTLGLVALVGVCWEFFEYIANNYIAVGEMQGNLADTMGDLLADLLGGLAVGLYFLPKIKTEEKSGQEIK